MLMLPDLENKPKSIQWLVMVTTWASWGIVVFGHGSRLAQGVDNLYFLLFGLSGICFSLSLVLCLAEWIIRSALHWQNNTHVIHTRWLPLEIESKLFFLPFFKFSSTCFLMLMLLGFFVIATASIVYLISFGHFGFMGNFGFGVEKM